MSSTANRSTQTITIHSTREQVTADVLEMGLGTHRDSDGGYAGRHHVKYARSADGRFFRLNRARHWTLARDHTLAWAMEAFRRSDEAANA